MYSKNYLLSNLLFTYFYLFAVSPDIDDTETSADFSISEGENVTLVCKATGHPQPRILWRRENGDKLILHTGTHQTEKGSFMFKPYIRIRCNVFCKCKKLFN